MDQLPLEALQTLVVEMDPFDLWRCQTKQLFLASQIPSLLKDKTTLTFLCVRWNLPVVDTFAAFLEHWNKEHLFKKNITLDYMLKYWEVAFAGLLPIALHEALFHDRVDFLAALRAKTHLKLSFTKDKKRVNYQSRERKLKQKCRLLPLSERGDEKVLSLLHPFFIGQEEYCLLKKHMQDFSQSLQINEEVFDDLDDEYLMAHCLITGRFDLAQKLVSPALDGYGVITLLPKSIMFTNCKKDWEHYLDMYIFLVEKCDIQIIDDTCLYWGLRARGITKITLNDECECLDTLLNCCLFLQYALQRPELFAQEDANLREENIKENLHWLRCGKGTQFLIEKYLLTFA